MCVSAPALSRRLREAREQLDTLLIPPIKASTAAGPPTMESRFALPTSLGFPFGGLRRGGGALIGIAAFIALLHVVGWGTLIAIIVPQHLNAGTAAFGLGIGFTAYMLGARHAFDADHIAAIDNTTRKLVHEGKPTVAVGFWFSFGHSTVVFALTLILAFGVRAVVEPMLDENSAFHSVAGLIGTAISSGFLFLIAALNIAVLGDVWMAFRRMRNGQYDEAALEAQLENRGMMSRLIGRGMKIVTQPWQMFLVGLLFGLGFDTATEVALLALTSSGVASQLPLYAVLCLPILFAAGMSLFDTLSGSFMTVAYGWALAKPVRKIRYNLLVTGLSVAVALIIGTVQMINLFGESLDLDGPIWRYTAALNLNLVGFVIVALFVAAWAGAVAIWRYGRSEEPLACAPAPSSAGNP
jgi:nickel/cobalt transporter (NiCoT) family protein